jgi:hypothetical protein
MVALLSVTACPGGGVPGAPGIPGSGAGKVNPNDCGQYSASEAGRKIKAFLEATVALQAAVQDTEDTAKQACQAMGKELGMAGLDGSTKDVCNKAFAELEAHIKLGVKTKADLKVNYEPAVCEVNVEAAASAAAKCEAKAEADIAVTCEGECTASCGGSCSGTCNGKCDGTCSGSTGAGGECNGQCEGTCEGSCSAGCAGSCSGGCEGHADVQASAECEAKAEVSASVEAKCTEPKLEVTYEAGVVLDKSKLEAAERAIKAGIPKLLVIGAKINGPLKAAFVTWAASAKKLKGAAADMRSALGDQFMCVSGQLAAAAGMIAQINVSIEVQVEVSASASGSVGG